MPDLSSSLTDIRASGHQMRLWAAIFAGSVVYTADIDAVDGTYTVSELTISGGVGTFSDVKRGAEVRIYNATGDYKGSVRIRRAGTLSTSNIPIAETARGSVGIVAGDTLAVLNDHRLRPVFPEASTDFDPDKETYTNQTEVIAPVALSGGHYASFVDSGQAYATIQFYGSNSFTLDDNSGGSVTHSWTFPSGSTPTSSTSADPSVQIPVGEHIIEHTVTDSSNSKTATQYVWCGVYDSNNLPYRVDADSLQLSGTEDMGWESAFNLVNSYGTDDIPDGAWVVIFAEEIYNGTAQSFGNRNSDRASIKFVGVLQNDTSEYTGDTGRQDLQFTAVSPLQVLREIAGFSQYFDSKTTATTWQEIEDLTAKKAFIHLLRTYTTALEILDFYYEADDYSYPALALQKDTPYGQLMEIAGGLESRFSADRTCNLAVQRYPEFYEIADRSGLTTTLTLSERDILRIRVERSHREPVRILEGRGFTTSGINLGTAFSRWPSLTPGEGSQDSVIDWLLIDGQSDLNAKTGQHGAKLNHVYIASDGEKQIAPRITVDVYRDVFDFWQEWIAFSLDATSNWREIDLSAFRWVIREINPSYRANTVDIVTLTLDAETAGPAGQTYIPPETDGNQLPEIEFPLIEWIPPALPWFPEITFGQGDGRAAIVTSDGRILITTNWNDTVPAWTEYNHSTSFTDATITSYSTDASSTFFTNGDGTGKVAAWLTSRDGIYHVDDIFDATPTITKQHSFANGSLTTRNPHIDSDFIFAPGQKAVATYCDFDVEHYAVYTSDGVNWTETTIDPSLNTGGVLGPAWVHYSTATANTVFCSAAVDTSGSGGKNAYILMKSTTNGASWTAVDPAFNQFRYGNAQQSWRTLYFPFRKAGDTICWSGWSNTQPWAGDTSVPISAAYENDDWAVSAGKFAYQCAYAKDIAFLCAKINAGGAPTQIMYTNNVGSTTPAWFPLSGTYSASNNPYTGCDCNPTGTKVVYWNAGNVYLWDSGSVSQKYDADRNPIYVFVK